MLHTLLPAEPAVAFMSSTVLTKDHPSLVHRVYIPSQKEVAERVTGLSLEGSDIPPNQLCVILPPLYTTPGSQEGPKVSGLGRTTGRGSIRTTRGSRLSLWVPTS